MELFRQPAAYSQTNCLANPQDLVEVLQEDEMAATLNRWNTRGLTACAIALISFAAGALITTRLTITSQVRADSNHVFELRIYHAVPGKLPALEARFRDTTSKLLAKHNLKVVGYWEPEPGPGWDNSFVFMVDHASREEAKKNWAAFVADPGFQEVIKSEQAEKLSEKVDSTYMLPTDFSPMK
jgi:NIPSNAP